MRVPPGKSTTSPSRAFMPYSLKDLCLRQFRAPNLWDKPKDLYRR